MINSNSSMLVKYKEIAKEDPVALILFMALVNSKKFGGLHYAKTTQAELAEKTGYSLSKIQKSMSVLYKYNFVFYCRENSAYVLSPSVIRDGNFEDYAFFPDATPPEMFEEIKFNNFVKWDYHVSCQRKMVKMFKNKAKAFAAFFIMSIMMNKIGEFVSQKGKYIRAIKTVVKILAQSLDCSIRTVYRILSFLKKNKFIQKIQTARKKTFKLNVTISWKFFKKASMFREDILNLQNLVDSYRAQTASTRKSKLAFRLEVQRHAYHLI